MGGQKHDQGFALTRVLWADIAAQDEDDKDAEDIATPCFDLGFEVAAYSHECAGDGAAASDDAAWCGGCSEDLAVAIAEMEAAVGRLMRQHEEREFLRCQLRARAGRLVLGDEGAGDHRRRSWRFRGAGQC